MLRTVLVAILILIAGCAQLPPSTAEIQAKKFESVPGKAVIYIVRGSPDLFEGHGQFALDDSMAITMFQGNFFRWEVAPGTHRIAGTPPDLSRLTINAEAGKIYFVQHTVFGSRFQSWNSGGALKMLSDQDGRRMVGRATLAGNG